MGVPEHFSSDVVTRCQSLLDHLLPKVAAGLPDDRKHGGTLRATFLLAMATPMLLLPIERVFKPAGSEVAADDRQLDQGVAARVADVFGADVEFGQTPFFEDCRWAYVQKHPLFNIADRWPSDLLDRLRSDESYQEARTAPARRILLDLRNALAHGGVTYLNENGENSYGEASAFAFVATSRRKKKIEGLKILLVSEPDFRCFLEKWARWVERSPLAGVLRDQNRIAA